MIVSFLSFFSKKHMFSMFWAKRARKEPKNQINFQSHTHKKEKKGPVGNPETNLFIQ